MKAIQPPKLCPRCLAWLDRTLFYANRSTADGLQVHCKGCQRYYAGRLRLRLQAERQADIDRFLADLIRHGKVCTTCGTHKPLADFRRDKSRLGGVGSQCKQCSSAHRRLRYSTDPGLREKARARSLAHVESEQDRARRIARQQSDRDHLHDRYIRKLMTEAGWPARKITTQLLTLKREQLFARRLSGSLRDAIEDYKPTVERPENSVARVENERDKRNAAYRARYAANKQKERARIKAYKALHPEKLRAQRERAKQRARAARIESAIPAAAPAQVTSERSDS